MFTNISPNLVTLFNGCTKKFWRRFRNHFVDGFGWRTKISKQFAVVSKLVQFGADVMNFQIGLEMQTFLFQLEKKMDTAKQ
jgi:hypothetical protein